MPEPVQVPVHAAREVSGRTVLVAVDDSEAAVKALVWAVRHAAELDMWVEVLTVWPSHRGALIHEVPGHFNEARSIAHAAQEDAIRRALEAVPRGPVPASRLENADPAAAIVRASARCALVVLGSDAGDSSHSLTDHVLAGAHCEVVVVQ